jgi:hypothetical protein
MVTTFQAGSMERFALIGLSNGVHAGNYEVNAANVKTICDSLRIYNGVS